MSRVLVTYPVDSLVSYHYYGKDRDMEAITATGRLRLIGDSGAYSAFSQGAAIRLGEYAEWCTKWKAHLYWIAALDVIGDPLGTFKNWQALRDRHGLTTIPTLHAGTPTRWLDAYVAEGVDFLGLGGMVGGSLRAFPWLVQTFRYARDKHPQVRFHGWGITHRKLVDALPFYSVDSSGTLGQAYRFGTLKLFDPATGKHRSVKLDGRAVYRVAELLRHTYGVKPATIAISVPSNRATLIQVAAASTQQYAAWLQRRHQVAAPVVGVNPACVPDPGTRVHLVSGTQQAPGRTDLDAVVGGPPDGTRVHLAGASPGRTVDELMVTATGGTRVHLVDGSLGNLTAVTKISESTE